MDLYENNITQHGGMSMEVRLNFIERLLMKLGDLFFEAHRKINFIVYKRYDKENRYRSHHYYPDSGELVFKELRKKES